jgi:hypothetical protein
MSLFTQYARWLGRHGQRRRPPTPTRERGGRNVTRWLILWAVVLGLPFGLPTAARATLLTYTFTAIGSGSLGANTFSNASFTITTTADTNQVTSLGGSIVVPDLTATVCVSGFETATFTFATKNVDNQGLSRAGLSGEFFPAILFEDNAAFSTYDLTTPIGPLTGPPSFNSGANFPTTAGNFSLRAVSDVTFEATTAQAAPEPSLLALLGIGTATLAGWRWCKHRRALA